VSRDDVVARTEELLAEVAQLPLASTPARRPERTEPQGEHEYRAETLCAFQFGRGRMRLRIALKDAHGHRVVDLRVEEGRPDRTWFATPRGVRLKPDQLDEAIAALERAREKLRSGW
jgi:hypothetical protein